MNNTSLTKNKKTQIVILGGGFAGAETARCLDRTAAKRGDRTTGR